MYCKEITDGELRKIILRKLRNRGCWGERYAPFDALVNWLSKKLKRDGKRVRSAVNRLVKEGYLIAHKGGATISLNPRRSREIVEFLLH